MDLDLRDVWDRTVVKLERDASERLAVHYAAKIEMSICGDATNFDIVFKLDDEIVLR